ncbi:MAG: DUF4411 family protein [Rhodoglobus sp.]
MTSHRYVWDTSALVGAWVRHYPPDVVPGLWKRMEEFARSGRMTVPEEVLEELAEKDDELHTWVKKRKETLVTPTTGDVMLAARAVLQDHPGLTKTGTGRGKADPFVIATAARYGLIMVTEEQGGSETKPRIPFVCKTRSVEAQSVIDFLRAEKWTFQ